MLPLSIFQMFWELGIGSLVLLWIMVLVGMLYFILNKPFEAINIFFTQ